MSFFSLKIRPFLRNLGIISLMLCLTVFVTYFADTLTRKDANVAAKANAETTLKNEVSAEKPMTAAEQEEHIDFLLYGYPRSRYRIGTMLSQGDTSLLCGFQTEFRTDLQSAFGDVISRDSRDEPNREAIESVLLRHFDGKSSRALSLYEASLNTDREQGIRLMDELLDLPKEERMPLEALAKYRRARLKMSLEDWAGLSDDDVRARLRSIREDFAAVPQLARDGSLDPAKVSENAAYWIAFTRSMILPSQRLIALGEADYAGAVETYLRMPRRGEANAVNSCLHLLLKLCEEKNLQPALASENLRKLMTFYLASAGGDFPDTRLGSDSLKASSIAWLDLISESKTDPSFALRHLAVIQYRCDRWQACRDTAARLPKTDPLRQLLLSRCNLRLTGDLSASRSLLEGADPAKIVAASAQTTPATGFYDYSVIIDLKSEAELRERVSGERGMLALSAGEFPEALRLFDEGRYAEDAFYVAECLMPLDELKAYVDRRRSAKAPLIKYRWYYGNNDFDDLEYELCSRLMRAGRTEEALDYVNPDIRAKTASYLLLLRAAERTDVSPRERADSYWRAALLVRQIGETVLHSPYGLSWSGGEGWHVSHSYIPGFRSRSFEYTYGVPEMKVLTCGAEELRRLREWESLHMGASARSERDARYAAFELALKAARLLPDNDPAGAQIVQYAGNLLKYREPKAAMPAYRLLISRFKQTPFGAHALKANWFSGERPEPPSDILSR
ncbi:MAG: hypothetical protein RLZZ233_813 [Verrucomicrobiota bacterium]|jgi:hypothetical protein